MNGAVGGRRNRRMAARFVNIGRGTPMPLPPDLREWVSADHMVRFIMDAVETPDPGGARVNHRGAGDAQYPPGMMLGLLTHSCATGTSSSRRIEALAHGNVAVRYLCANTHPDHDSARRFRRADKELPERGFHGVPEPAAESKAPKVGGVTVAVDGTKIPANASKRGAAGHGHAVGKMKEAREQTAERLAKAEDADSAPLQDGPGVPEEAARREARIEGLREAGEAVERRAAQRLSLEKAEHEAKPAERRAREEATRRKARGREPRPPKEGPGEKDRYNFTDPQGRIMKGGSGFGQCCNAQAPVGAGSMPVVGAHVTGAPSDKGQLVPAPGRWPGPWPGFRPATASTARRRCRRRRTAATGRGCVRPPGDTGTVVAWRNPESTTIRPRRPRGRRGPRSWGSARAPGRAGSFTPCASRPSDRPSASSSRPWASAASFCAGWRRRAWSGPW